MSESAEAKCDPFLQILEPMVRKLLADKDGWEAEDWDEEAFQGFFSEIALWLQNEKKEKPRVVAKTVAGLISYGVTTEEELQKIGRGEYKDFKAELVAEGVPKAICDLLFEKYCKSHSTKSKRPRLDISYDSIVQEGLVEWDMDELAESNLDQDVDVGQLFTIPMLHISGLLERSTPAELHYCRQETKNIWQFIDEVRKSTRKYGYLDGLPGVGKSSALWYHIIKEGRKSENIVWIHIQKTSLTQVVIFLAGKIYTKSCILSHLVESEFIQTFPDQSFLILDGLTGDLAGTITPSCLFWVNNQQNNYALLCKSGKFDCSENGPPPRLEVLSWSKIDFITALSAQQKELWRSKIGTAFSNVSDSTSIEEAVDIKWFYSGGSARWMLGLSEVTVKSMIETYVSRCSDKKALFSGRMGPTSCTSSSHLLAKYEGDSDFSIISSFAAQLLVRDGDENLLQLMYSITNASYQGRVFEFDFFFQLEKCLRTRKPLLLNDSNDQVVSLVVDKVLQWDGKTDAFGTVDFRENIWFKPTKWTQAGFDAVQSKPNDDKFDLTFVQVTISSKHALKLTPFGDFVRIFTEGGREVSTCSIIFLSPSDRKDPVSVVEFVRNGTMSQLGWDLTTAQSKVKQYKMAKTSQL